MTTGPTSPPAPKPRLKRLRFLAILLAVLLLGLVSFVFGMFVAVASDLPSLTRFSQFKNAKSSVLLDDLGHPIGVLSQQNRVIVTPGQIPQIVKEAVISIEDKRFETNSGVDIRGIARAFVQDVVHRGDVQGASTIEQQFIKNALQAQSHRTIFEKLREAALAYQLSHKWSKEKIITAYLNTIYFGNGAYGIEAAAQTYFGGDVNHLGCGTPSHELCVEQLQPWEAALLAGIIQSPTAYDPVNHPLAAQSAAQRGAAPDARTGLPDEGGVRRKRRAGAAGAAERPGAAGADRRRGRRRLLHELGAAAGDRTLRRAARLRRRPAHQDDAGPRTAARGRTGRQRLPRLRRRPDGLARGDRKLDRRGARDGRRAQLRRKPFNLATEGERQPGSSFKAFDLAAALEDGISPDSVWTSKEKEFIVPNTHGHERFVVHNDEGNYTGSNTLTGATAFSDNSIYAEVGLKVGTKQHRAPGPPDGHHDPAVDQPGDDDRRADGRRHAARHGPRLRDDRPRRAARERHAGRSRRARRDPGSRSRRPAAARRRPPRQEPGADQAGAAPEVAADRDLDARNGAPVRHRARPPRSASSRPARRAPPPTTATPGSSAGTPSTRSPCGSATPTS